MSYEDLFCGGNIGREIVDFVGGVLFRTVTCRCLKADSPFVACVWTGCFYLNTVESVGVDNVIISLHTNRAEDHDAVFKALSYKLSFTDIAG